MEDGDSSLKVLLKSFSGFMDITITSKSETVHKTPEMIFTLKNKEGTIGFEPNDVAEEANLNVLAIDGQKPTEAGYSITGTLALIFKTRNYTGNIKKFVEFATFPEAHVVIKAKGGLPN